MLGAPCVAGAQTSEVSALLREGVALRVEGRDAEALSRFTDAWARCRCAEARAQMGLAAQAMGRFTLAEAWLSEALAAHSDRWVQANRVELEAANGEVRARTASLIVRGEPGAAVRVDEDVRGEVDVGGSLALRVDPGSHQVSLLSRDGRRASASLVAIAGGESALRVEVPPRALAVDVRATVPPVTTRASGWRRAAPWVAVAGAAGVVAGGVAFAFERRYTAIWESPTCLDGNRTREENCAPWRQSAERAEAATIASWAVGGALLVSAAALWWIAPRTVQRVALRCGPTILGGVMCGGAF
jgi:hypothetical protein